MTIRSTAIAIVVACSAMTMLFASETFAGPGGRGLAARPAHAFSSQAIPAHRAFALRAFAHRGRKFHGRRHDGVGSGAFGGFVTSWPSDEYVDAIESPTYVAVPPPLQCRRSEEIKTVPSENGGTREIKITRTSCLPW